MRDEGIQTIVWLCPILPFINDTEENIRGLLNYCIEANVYGIIHWGIGMTLREGNREYFYAKLDKHFPGIKEKYQQKYGNSYQLLSDNNRFLMNIFNQECKNHHIRNDTDALFEYLSTFEDKTKVKQMELFDTAD
jgi:DNA repair photolyase